MGKRKRGVEEEDNSRADHGKRHVNTTQPAKEAANGFTVPETIQIVTGSYDRVLHGFTATIDLSKVNIDDSDAQPEVSFADTFLFNAHASAVRCLALSPMASGAEGAPSKFILASGSTDERINLYSLSANVPSLSPSNSLSLPSLSSVARLENSKNRELGSLMHHSSSVTQLHFATTSKLLSASEDNTIAVSRTRDWAVLSIFKAPVPRAQGRPSGDTAPLGGTPAGINDFDIHPSMKFMISVGKGEKCMRLWNLVTGKKAAALNFEKDLLQALGESKYASGEARKIVFSPDGESFAVGFDRGAALYNLQIQIQGISLPTPRTKIHQMRFLPAKNSSILALSTDDGRILFYDTKKTNETTNESSKPGFAHFKVLGQIGGPSAGVANRVKDFEILEAKSLPSNLLILSGNSDGTIRVWHLDPSILTAPADAVISKKSNTGGPSNAIATPTSKSSVREGAGNAVIYQVGKLLGRFDTANRITCLKAFIMLPALAKPVREDDAHGVEHDDEVEDDFEGFAQDSDSH